ncbi:hypothetical protein HOO54_19750 [Bacillus sp. WMMC1349]|uniref:hypothetical protein n=1 Tax=Bacillus sp. WMMC1349 TaxID=2736254 RepID=UPI001555AA68|nr:hypothetical protein [Bacillus sp. WMMC1349]NPC94394.1 hypothetical protein [Bacillus sp. WMMC1349]
MRKSIDLSGFIILLVWCGLCFLAALLFYQLYEKLQISLLASSDRLFFSSDPFKFYYLFLVFFLMPFALQTVKKGSRFLPFSRILFVVGIILLWNGMFQYQEVKKNDMYVRDGWLSITNHYTIKDIVSVDANYHKRITGTFMLDYDLELKNGNKVSFTMSDDFYEHAVKLDELLKQQGIHIERSGIKQSDEAELANQYDDKVGSQTKFKIIQRLLTGR